MTELDKEIKKIIFKETDHDSFTPIKKIVDFYAKLFDLNPLDILKGLESQREMSISGYYSESRFPIKKEHIVIFEDEKDLRKRADPKKGFRCPHCKGISKHPYQCNSGIKLVLINSEGKKEICNWKSFGLFGTLGKGMTFTLKSIWPHKPFVDESFMPISMEEKDESKQN